MMPSDPPFVDLDSGALDLAQIRAELFPLAGLIMLFGGLALVPFLFAVLLRGVTLASTFFAILGQFVLALGTGIVLMYVIARGIDLAGA